MTSTAKNESNQNQLPVFLQGVNIDQEHVRTIADRLIELLKGTEIEWLRIHPLPTRRLDASFLKALDKFCAAGYNLIIPIDVGVVENVGKVALKDLDNFVDTSYDFSRKAVTEVSRIVNKYERDVIYGVENEIDTKEWFLQSLPIVGWRKNFDAWFKLATDANLKYERLNNILRGIKEADSRAKTMANVEADDLEHFASDIPSHLRWSEKVLRELDIIDRAVLNYLETWEVELERVKQRLPIDLVGLDNYPNYLRKYPVGGAEIGGKLDKAIEISGKPAINCEFGYTTYRPLWEKIWYKLQGIQSPTVLQFQFFENALQSIRKSASRGTFPWASVTEPYKKATPREENGFGLLKINAHGEISQEPAFNLYLSWLKARAK
jgi:hypothetical protein